MISPMLNQISSNNNGLEKMEDKVLPTKSVDEEKSITLSTSAKSSIPYTAIFSPVSDCFLRDVPIEAKIVHHEESRSVLSLSQYLYHIELKHGNFTWIIKRRHNNFRSLHQQIWLFYTTLTLPLPTHNNRENRKVLAKIGDIEFPKFPMIPETIFIHQVIGKRIRLLEEYLQFILSLSLFRSHPAVLNFLQISPFSFIEDLGNKGEEFMVKKRAGGFRKAAFCTRMENFFTDFTGHWRNRGLLVKDTCLFYYRLKDKKIRYVMLFDKDFCADSGIKQTGVQHGVRIKNLSRQLIVKTKNPKELADYLNEYAQRYAKEFLSFNTYGSFAPVRKDTDCQWFVDGSAYFEAVSQAIQMAEQEIFITDWWLSPEIYLKRPSFANQWRLDTMLQKKAEQGVRIFILLYKEFELGISINSVYTKRTLMKMHKNIAVLRHPDAARGGTLLWSHHEKLVVIDQKYAFVGGIDLCFGRWDNFEHRLTDQGGISFQHNDDIVIHNSTKPTGLRYRSISQPLLSDGVSTTSEEPEKFGANLTVPGFQPSVSPMKKSISNEKGIDEVDNRINRSASFSVQGGPSRSERKFKKNEIKPGFRNRISTKIRTKRNQAITKFRKINRRIRNKITDSGGDDISYISTDIENNDDFIKQSIPKIQTDIDHIATDELEGGAKLWIGKDYTNFIVKDFNNLNLPFQDSIDRHTTPRMPWHDISCMVVGAAARDVARHFIQRWNFTKYSKAKSNDRYPCLIPRTYQKVNELSIPPFLLRTHRVTCQVLRSVSSWSAGIKRTEASILEAYMDAISNAEHYIYIENQFFISQTITHSDGDYVVRNRIAEALYRRIIRAFRNKETFRVFILIPLLPAFEGEVGTSSGSAIQQITHYNYSTICKGENSLLGKLKQEIDDPSQYIGFYSLRNYDELNGRLITELIYVHSKLLIVDDRVTIIGSANINDRSMMGYRDSEVAVIIDDQEFELQSMNGKPYRSGRFAGSLRRMLMREHLGIYTKSSSNDDQQLQLKLDCVNDPIHDHFWFQIWNYTARLNTMIYEQVFAVIPTDEIKTFAQIPEYMEKTKLYKVDKAKAQERLTSIHGHLVFLPLEFLSKESTPTNVYNAQDHFIPQIVWT